jgi:hypothetical protein
MTPDQRATHFKTIDRQRAAYIVWARGQFRKAFRDGFAQWLRTESMDADLYPSEPMERAYRIVWSRVGNEFAKRTARQIEAENKRITATENDYRDSLMAYLTAIGAERVVNVNQTTIDKLRAIITNAVNQGKSIPETVRLIQSDFNVMAQYRAERIARTEIIGASNRGAMEAANATGLTLKKIWISTRDDRTRSFEKGDEYDHMALDGVEVELHENFMPGNVPGGVSMPGDLDAPAGFVINCRCTVAFKQVRFDN